jgi:PIN domain nuclease of toxin-antitoxin system
VITDGLSAVLDASALLAYLRNEPGSQTVEGALAAGAAINAINYAEVLTRLGDADEDPVAAHRRFREQGLIGGLVTVVPVTEEDALAIARLRAITRTRGLSIGDRACLATGLRLDRPVITADRTWASLNLGVSVHLIRP